MSVYNVTDLEKLYQENTGSCVCYCTFETESVGGVSPDRKQAESYVKHHLGKFPGLDPKNEEQVNEAVNRILKEELALPVSDTVVPLETENELKESSVYSVTSVRRHPVYGPWIGNWMIKAAIKVGASRIGLTTKKRGSKGDIAEAGRVIAIGDSRHPDAAVDQIFVYNEDGSPVETYYKTFKGSVNTPSGRKSIVQDCECIPAGTRFAFEFRFGRVKLVEKDVAQMMAMTQRAGIGSSRSFERGNFRIDSMEITMPDNPKSE